MRTFFLDGQQKLVEGLGAVVAGGSGYHAAGPCVVEDFSLGVGIVLGVLDAGGHVEQLTHGDVAKTGVLEFGNVGRGECVLVDHTLRHQHGAQGAYERLGHRHGDVLTLRLEHTEVALVDDAALVHHHDAIGVVGAQRLRPGHGLARAQHLKTHRVEVLARGQGQHADRPGAACHVAGRHKLAVVGK